MKAILKNLPWMIIGFVGFTIITIMDFVLLMMAVCVKAVRSLIIWSINVMDLDSEDADASSVKQWAILMVNRAYKYYVDKLYPVKEDEEESE